MIHSVGIILSFLILINSEFQTHLAPRISEKNRAPVYIDSQTAVCLDTRDQEQNQGVYSHRSCSLHVLPSLSACLNLKNLIRLVPWMLFWFFFYFTGCSFSVPLAKPSISPSPDFWRSESPRLRPQGFTCTYSLGELIRAHGLNTLTYTFRIYLESTESDPATLPPTI